MNQKVKSTGTLILIFFLFSGCANYKTHLAKHQEDWEQQNLSKNSKSEIDYSLYMVGDAGLVHEGKRSPSLNSLQTLLEADSQTKGVIYLGDNIYPNGMPRKEDSLERKAAELSLQYQIDAAKGLADDILFIPGNHDWYGEGGAKGLKRQAKFIEKQLGKKSYPIEPGCSGPEVMDLNEHTGLVMIDSKWFLEDWDKYSEFNEDCPYKTREAFLLDLGEELKAYRYKRLIIALHHPLVSNGHHGGFFSTKTHLFPFTMFAKKAYVPLPGVGSFLVFLRNTAGISEDLSNPVYERMIADLELLVEHYQDVIFISGHEHNLQYHEIDGKHHIISGSGSKKSPVAGGRDLEFGIGDYGLSKLNLYKDGAIGVEFYSATNEKEQPELLFSKILTGDLSEKREIKLEYPSIENGKLVEETIYDKSIQKSGLFKLFFGANYSYLYNFEFEAPILDLEEELGGLEVIKRGGGNQTNSLRLEAGDGKQYTIRDLKKDATRFLPASFSNSIAVELLEYQFTATHPLAALAVPDLAASVDVYHTNPKLVYVPVQPNLKEYNTKYSNKLYLFEERPAGDWSDTDLFGSSSKIVSTGKVLEKTMEKHDHRVDQNAVIRARMFDMLIGDWDRHDDQWRWANFEQDEIDIYKPIPRDRDQAFARYQGVTPAFGRMMGPGTAMFNKYSKKYGRIKGLNFAARYFDRTFLNELEWEDWKKEIDHIVLNMDSVSIDKAFASWPEGVFAYKGEEIKQAFKDRMLTLEETGWKYYKRLAEKVEVTGTLAGDYFLAERLPNGDTRVSVYDLNKKNRPDELFYQRTFKKDETKEVLLFGLDGKDIFKVTGSSKKGIKLRLIGGNDKDLYTDSSHVNGISKKTLVYDYPEHSILHKSNETSDKRSEDYLLNNYNRKRFKPNILTTIPIVGFNPDQGLVVGGFLSYKNFGFGKDPYYGKHDLSGIYSITTNGFRIEYDGHFTRVLGKVGIKPYMLYQDPFFTNNFFGYGNETSLDVTDDKDYYRVRAEIRRLDLKFDFPISHYGSFTIGPAFQLINLERTEGRYIADLFPPDYDGFESRPFAGATAALDLEHVSDVFNPETGLRIHLGFQHLFDVEYGAYDLTQFRGSLAFYSSLVKSGKLVFASRTGYHANFNDNFLAYQSQFVGGNMGLRGFRNQRFAGQKAFYQNVDIRWKISAIKSYILPTSLGLYGGFDLGRVWMPGESSGVWHTSYGGGIWLQPFSFIIVKAGYFQSKEQGRFTFGIGFDF